MKQKEKQEGIPLRILDDAKYFKTKKEIEKFYLQNKDTLNEMSRALKRNFLLYFMKKFGNHRSAITTEIELEIKRLEGR